MELDRGRDSGTPPLLRDSALRSAPMVQALGHDVDVKTTTTTEVAHG